MASRPAKPARPLSPHLTIWKWGPHMLVSIVHRACGVGMALVGVPLLLWWLVSAAAGPAAYAGFVDTFTVADGGLNIVGYVIGIGLTLALFQHMMTGLRHFVLDTGAGYALKVNKTFATLTMVASTTLTIVFWLYILGGK